MKHLAFLFAVAFSATAQVVPNQYIVELSNAPVARIAASKHRRLLRADPELASHRAIVEKEQSQMRAAIEDSNTQVLDQFQTVHNAVVVRMSPERAAQIRGMQGVSSVRKVRVYHKLLDRSLPLQRVVDAWQQLGGSDKAGVGVKIGIIDTGIDVTHPAFQNSGLSVPDGFPKVVRQSDTVYTNNKVIVARGYTYNGRAYSANDVDGHGTGVAMIAAGGTNTGQFGTITGVAPKAWLGSYKVFPDGAEGAPDSLIIRAIEDAVNDGMDVLNLSLGGFPATRPADDSLVIAVENAAAAGKVVVIAAGNDGSTPNTIGSPGTAPSAISVGSSMNDRIFAGKVSIDGQSPFTAIPGDGKNSATPITGTVKDITPLDSTALACDSLPSGSLKGNVALIERGTCTFSVKLNNAASAGAIAAIIYARPEAPDAVGMSTSGATLPAVMISNADGTKLQQSAASGAIVATVDFSMSPSMVNSNVLSDFSSLGPNSDNGIKPDLLGVGENISTAKPVSQGSYVVESGTSFSSPTVAGAAALLIGARPGLTAAQYRSLLINSTSTFSPDASKPLGIQSAGTGLLNMAGSLSSAVTASPVSLSFGISGGDIDRNQTVTFTNSGSATDTFAITAQPIGGGPVPTLSTNSVQLAPGQSQNISVRLTGAHLAGGIYQGYLQIQGTQNPVTSRVSYWYGVPTQSARYVQVLDAPSQVRRGSTFDIEFRILDVNGIPVTDGIDGSILSGATVIGVESSDSDIPGSFLFHVQAPPTRGTLSLQLLDGDASAPVSLRVI